jgi:ferredoxin
MKQLRLDPIECDGHGLCAELFPEWIQTDDWGYPIIDDRPIPSNLEVHARRAIKECPKLALRFATMTRGRQPPSPQGSAKNP